MNALGVILGFVGRVLEAVFQPMLLLWAGRRIERGARAEKDNEVKDAQAKAALDAPRSRAELAERLRNGKL